MDKMIEAPGGETRPIDEAQIAWLKAVDAELAALNKTMGSINGKMSFFVFIIIIWIIVSILGALLSL